MEPQVSIESVNFSDGTTLNLAGDDIVVIVGPNNAGKSAALRGIRDKLQSRRNSNPVIGAITITKHGTSHDVREWLDRWATQTSSSPGDHVLSALGEHISHSQVAYHWETEADSVLELRRFFCHLISGEERLTAANPAPNIALGHDPASHPIHFLLRDDSIEKRLSDQFREAFGVDLIVHRNAGSRVPLYTGERPTLAPGEDRVSIGYVRRLEELPMLQDQGDGMRSFASVLLQSTVGRESVLLIDEPEAFLHPPQARLLGRMLVSSKEVGRQLFIATHSGDVLRGILDASKNNIRVVRLRRTSDFNLAKELSNDEIALLWKDPLLRNSNILDGLFHERVVISEGDADSRFYAAVTDAIYSLRGSEGRRPDVMFTHSSGASRLSMVQQSLRQLDVPVVTVVDFDVLRDEHVLRSLITGAGGIWTDIEADWRLVKSSVEARKPSMTLPDIKNAIQTELSSATGDALSDVVRRRLNAILKRASPWGDAKEQGKAYLRSGAPTQAFERMSTKLREWGVFIVYVGELEGFVRSVDGHGPAWINEVLSEKDLLSPELEPARRFVNSFVP